MAKKEKWNEWYSRYDKNALVKILLAFLMIVSLLVYLFVRSQNHKDQEFELLTAQKSPEEVISLFYSTYENMDIHLQEKLVNTRKINALNNRIMAVTLGESWDFIESTSHGSDITGTEGRVRFMTPQEWKAAGAELPDNRTRVMGIEILKILPLDQDKFKVTYHLYNTMLSQLDLETQKHGELDIWFCTDIIQMKSKGDGWIIHSISQIEEIRDLKIEDVI